MMRAIAHRGPDGSGHHIESDERLYLGHLRLAILDIAGGAQPMWNETDDVGIVFNGEIYNHVELRRQLECAGHAFRSDHSDTEVLVHGYEEWGEELPARLNGMFAFAIWHRRHRRLFLARDRFGEKPLFYASRPGLFAFASEMTALLAHRCIDRSLDVSGIEKAFAFGFFPAPTTHCKAIRKLPGGHHLTYDLATETVVVKRFWRFALATDTRMRAMPIETVAEELSALIDQAVSRRLISDVPLGIFLSGGVDSSAIVAAARNLMPSAQIDTFTIGFTEPSFDESAYARTIAEQFRTCHHEQILDIAQARDLIPDLLRRIGEPLGDASILPTFLVARFARTRVSVALTGDGGDELFAGYDPFKALGPASIYSQLVPAWLHRLLLKLALKLPISTRNMSLDFKLRRTLQGLSYDSRLWNPVWLGPLAPREMADVFAAPSAIARIYDEAITLWEGSASADPVDRTLEFYTTFYLQEGILTKADRASMLNSLETRAIFLDNDLVDFCMRLPRAFKYRHGERKVLLRAALKRHLPQAILDRPKKGFGIPLAAWLRETPSVVPMQPVDGMRSSSVEKMWREHRSGRADNRLALWLWLSLQAALPQSSSVVSGASHAT